MHFPYQHSNYFRKLSANFLSLLYWPQFMGGFRNDISNSVYNWLISHGIQIHRFPVTKNEIWSWDLKKVANQTKSQKCFLKRKIIETWTFSEQVENVRVFTHIDLQFNRNRAAYVTKIQFSTISEQHKTREEEKRNSLPWDC